MGTGLEDSKRQLCPSSRGVGVFELLAKCMPPPVSALDPNRAEGVPLLA